MAFNAIDMFPRRVQRGIIVAALVVAALFSFNVLTQLISQGIGMWIYRAALILSAFWVYKLM